MHKKCTSKAQKVHDECTKSAGQSTKKLIWIGPHIGGNYNRPWRDMLVSPRRGLSLSKQMSKRPTLAALNISDAFFLNEWEILVRQNEGQFCI